MTNKLPLLIDFDGVINLDGKIAPDANEFFSFLKEEKIPSLILSNSTLKSSYEIKKFLSLNNIETNIPIITTVDASVEYLKKNYSLSHQEKNNIFHIHLWCQVS